MSIEKVRAFFHELGDPVEIREFTVSSATVALAAQALGTQEAHIAKTLAFYGREGGCLLIVAAGDAKISNRKFKDVFGHKAKMMSHEETAQATGHTVGGVCPFALPPGVAVWLDRSLERFDLVYPAAGSASSAIPLTCAQLEQYARASGWVDVCDLPAAP